MKNWSLRLVIFLSKGADIAASLLPPSSSGTTRVVGMEESSWYMVTVIRLALAVTWYSTRQVATGTARLVFAHSDNKCRFWFTILTGYHIK